jgi:hypothetical protein
MPSDLNRELLATYAQLDGARERLSDFVYIAYVAIVLERVIKESGRIEFGQALRALRDNNR